MVDKEWIWVCVQHPMPLLVEDRGEPTVLERIPPWGDPSLKDYISKFRDVCESLERFPELRIDFEISAKELEDVAQESPATLARMKSLWTQGKLGFVGGDYSQAHYHVFGAESCLRQIERGLSVFRELIGCEVRVFFHQETGLHEQLPQILRAFGYTVAVPPRFPWALCFTAGMSVEIASHFGTLEFVRDDDLTNWEGLDGTSIPLYLSMPAPSLSEEILEVFQKHANVGFRAGAFEEKAPFENFMDRERYKAPVNVPRILIETPDMKRIPEEYITARSKVCVFSRLSDALDECLQKRSPVGAASLYPYWSYIEGVWAEQLSRSNRKAEISVFQAEALDSLRIFLQEGQPADMADIWKKILSSQHHDVYWIETTDLKRRAMRWLDEAVVESESISLKALQNIFSDADQDPSQPPCLYAVNTMPFARSGAFQLTTPGGIDPEGRRILRKALGDSLLILPGGSRDDSEELLLADMGRVPGLGWIQRPLDAKESRLSLDPGRSSADAFELETDHYRVRIERGGIISLLTEKETGAELIKESEVGANEIKGRLHTGDWVSNRDIRSQLTVVKSPFASVVSVNDELGPISFREDIILYRACARIDFRLTLGFGQTPLVLGDFWNDATKLNVFWPFSFATAVVHDIPFGVVPARSGRPIFCTSFSDMSDGRAGLSYFNRGTTKHWIKDRVLANVFAWGGNKFSNRHPGLWEHVDKYDLRLTGEHTIEYALFPHPGDYRGGNVPREAQHYAVPLCAYASKKALPPASSAKMGIDLAPVNLICTAVLPDANRLKLRVYEAFGKAVKQSDLRHSPGFSHCTVFDLSGRRIHTIHPFQICTIHLNGQANQ